MSLPEYQQDEPLTPVGRLFVQPLLEQIVSIAIFFKSPIDIPNFKSAVESSPLMQHPRFLSLLIRDRNGTEKWQKTELNLDRHIMIINNNDFSNNSDTTATGSEVNAYLADLAVSNPLSFDKPLWEIHILVAHNCAVLRIHHAIGDGMSLMSMLSACFQRTNHPDELLPTVISTNRKFIGRALWVKDTKTVISGGEGVEHWIRKLASTTFSMDDMKIVKSAIPNATINDVLFGVVSIGLSRYLDLRSPKASGVHLTGMSMVNLRKEPGLQDLMNMMKTNSKSRWGNEFACALLPVYYHEPGSNPIQYMIKVKAMLDRKKQSVSSYFNYRIVCNTTFTISNIVGPKEEMTFAGNTITSLRINSYSLPHAITMHMVSYAGKAELQILVAKDIIPDPEVLANCFEDALAKMKGASGTV